MLTTAIRDWVRTHLNRADLTDAQLQDWVNQAKRHIERRVNLAPMLATDSSLTVTNSAPTVTLPARLKQLLTVHYRKTLPATEAELSWTRIPELSEAEVLAVRTYQSATQQVTGAPLGYTLRASTLTVHPNPESGKTYTLYLVYYAFSPDWTFGAGEEPHLAQFAWDAVINYAVSYGFSSLGELQDSAVWASRGDAALAGVLRNEAARALSGVIELRPSTRANQRRPSRSFGWNDV